MKISWTKSATFILILINVIAFIGFQLSYSLTKNENYNIENYRFVYKDFSFILLVTSNFMHGELGHILGNIVLLLPFGIFLEQRIGSNKLVLSYLVTGVSGTLVQGWIIPTWMGLGASASVYGFVGLSSVVLLEDVLSARRRINNFSILVGFFIVLALFSFRDFATADWITGGGIAHLFGFVGGIGLGILFRVLEKGSTSAPPPPS